MGGSPSLQPWLPPQPVPEFFFTFPCISSSAPFVSPGKDARLFVFRLSAVQRGIEGKQAAWSRCDCRENKLEKTKGDSQPPGGWFRVRIPRFPWKLK